MKTIKTEINLYSYEELKGESKQKAFNDHKYFLECNSSQYEDKNGVMQYDKMEEWSETDIKEYVEDSININEYLFFENGEMAHITHFTDGHKKAGTTEFYLNGKTYILD